jgi:Na+/H+-dicarboxylate symporter
MTNQVAIAVGLLAGLAFGLLASATGSPFLLRVAEDVAPIGTAFVNLVRMVVIPLVAATLFTGVAALGNPRRLGRLGGATLLFFWASSFIAIGIGMILMRGALALAPITAQAPPAGATTQELPGAVDFLVGLIPSNPFAAAAEGALLPLIVFTVLFAAAAGTLPNEYKAPLMTLAEAVTAALIKLVHWVLLTAPVGVFALAAPVTARSGWAMLQSLAVFVVAVAVGLVIFVGAVYLPAVRIIGRVPVGAFLRACVGPWAIAASTTSSAATLPAMMEAAAERLGVSRVVAGLVLSLGASLNRAGSALFQGAAIVFLAALFDVRIPPAGVGAAVLATFLVSLTVTGVPSASVVTLAPALDSVGVPLAGLAVLFGVDRLPDMLRTAVNVTGTIAAATVVERLGRGTAPSPPPADEEAGASPPGQ